MNINTQPGKAGGVLFGVKDDVPDFIGVSPLAVAAGRVDVDQATLRHKTYDNIWPLGDVTNAPNAKPRAAARILAPVVPENIVADIRGGALPPSVPKAVIEGPKPSPAVRFLQENFLPPVYWQGMLKGREWMAKPEKVTVK